MTPAEITAERLDGWEIKLNSQNATPLVLVGIGLAPKAGTIVLCIPENGPSNREIAGLMVKVAEMLLDQ